MDADQDGVASVLGVSLDEGDVLRPVDCVAVADGAEVPESTGEVGIGLALDKAFRIEAVANEIGDGDEAKAVVPGVVDELGEACHGAIRVLDLADHGGGIETGKAGKIDGSLGVAGALENAATAGAQREDVAGPPKVSGSCGGMESDLDGAGAVLGGNAGGNPVLWTGIDADGEGGLVAVGIGTDHQRKIKDIETLTLHGNADETAGLGSHEVDLEGCGELGSADDVAFILAVLIIDDNDRLTVTNGGEAIDHGIHADHGAAFRELGKNSTDQITQIAIQSLYQIVFKDVATINLFKLIINREHTLLNVSSTEHR